MGLDKCLAAKAKYHTLQERPPHRRSCAMLRLCLDGGQARYSTLAAEAVLAVAGWPCAQAPVRHLHLCPQTLLA